MNVLLAERVQKIKPSPTLQLSAQANQLKLEGRDIINLTLGEPDFDTPNFIKAAAIKALHDGFTKYTAVEGTPALRKAIIDKFERENQLRYEMNQIVVSTGAKQSIYNLFQGLLNKHDEVLIPAPYWVSYPDMVLLASANPILLPTTWENNFKITPEQLEQSITAKTRLLIINAPSNPSGMSYSKTELFDLAAVLLRHPDVFILTDDIYEHIYWGKEPFVNLVNVCPELKTRTIVINGVSKAYAMTGFRIGYAAGPIEIIQAMIKIQSQCTSNPTSIAQVAAQAALEGNQDCVHEMKEAYQKRSRLVEQHLNKIPGISCLKATGTFYAFPSIKPFLNSTIPTDEALAFYLLKDAGVATVPGSAFGAPSCLRISFATDEKTLIRALNKLETSLEKLSFL